MTPSSFQRLAALGFALGLVATPGVADAIRPGVTINSVETALVTAPLGLSPATDIPGERCFLREGYNTGATLQACYGFSGDKVTVVRGFVRDPDLGDRLSAARTIMPRLLGVFLDAKDASRARTWLLARLKQNAPASTRIGGLSLDLRAPDRATLELVLKPR